jgi:uncharacterized repeat protein (TIGR04076 family)
MPKVSIEIPDFLEEETCPAGYKIGERFEYPEDMGKICPAAFNSIYPYIRVMESGGAYPFFEEPNAHSACCPDYKRPVVLKISRKSLSRD